ncbi:2Fe-2S iron-sulfur cluster binding protein [Advenella kashmirensis W13003]|uniref:2Fe-2S iron-sulfur cluster binding protein n=1 Tax=Advenella kashmirensis W13003 TaxID=1424334 RepID=V8QSF1_9BURK|nr:class I ribonucleotide reductase maintenance protein YfaE [Advenella kashmirensis]ETF02268.1 2Fe-2S iron-sulfur cluster binding protein [Advenella kashmirensis W13003]
MTSVVTTDSRFELLEGETLLEGLERTNHEVEFQCRAGYCGSCRTHLVSGKVRYLTDPLAYIARDEILPCCCVPQGPVQLEARLAHTPEQPVLGEEFNIQSSLDFGPNEPSE